MNTPLASWLLGLGALVSCAALADDRVTAAIVDAINDPTEQAHVLSVAQRSNVVMQNPCPTAHYTIARKFSLYLPVGLDGAGNISSGAWKQMVDAEGCGVRRVLNVLVSAQDAKGLSITPLLPGSTHADMVLQRDAVKFAAQALATVPGGREANCKVGYVADTEFIAQEDTVEPGGKGPAWREMWTLASCTQKMLVPMRFIPDATGTSIAAGPDSDIKVLPLPEGHL